MASLKITLVCLVWIFLLTNCSNEKSTRDCIDFDITVALMESKLQALEDNDFQSFRNLVYAKNEENIQLYYENWKSLYDLCRLIDARVGPKVFDERMKGTTYVYDGVPLINALFRDDWKRSENDMIEIQVQNDYHGAIVYINNIQPSFLVTCINEDIRLDLEAGWTGEPRSQFMEVVGAKSIERNRNLAKAIVEQNVQSWEQFAEVMRSEDWKIRYQAR